MLWSALLFCSTPLRYFFFPVYRTSLLFLLQSKKYSFCPSVERGKMVWYSLELIPKSSSRSWICFLFSGPTHQLFWFKMITMMWDETIYLKNCEVVEKVKISKSNMIQKLESKMNVNITGWGGNDFLYLRLRFWRECSVVWSLSGVEDHLDPFIILIHSHSHSCWDEPCISWQRNPNGVLIQTAAAAAMTNSLSESHGCISSASVFRPQMFLCSNISRMAPRFNHS